MTRLLTPAQAFLEAISRSRAWQLSLDGIDPTGADDRFVYIRNDGKLDLVIYDGELSSTVAGNVEPQLVTVASLTSTTDELDGTAVNVANLGGGGEKPEATIHTGVDITTLTTQKDLGHSYLIADTPRVLDLLCRLKRGQQWALNWEVATGILSGHIRLFEVAPGD